MREKTFLDTHYIVALATPKDAHHADAVRLAQEYMESPLVTTEAVLMEIGNGLARDRREYAVAIIEALRVKAGVEVVTVTSDLFNRGFELYSNRPDKTRGLVDCISFVVMKERGITDALTHDNHFNQAGFRALMRIGN